MLGARCRRLRWELVVLFHNPADVDVEHQRRPRVRQHIVDREHDAPHQPTREPHHEALDRHDHSRAGEHCHRYATEPDWHRAGPRRVALGGRIRHL